MERQQLIGSRRGMEHHRAQVDAILDTGPLPAMSAAALRHQEVIDEMSPRADVEPAPAGLDDEPGVRDDPKNSA